MTYKAIVKRMIEIEATRFVEKTLDANEVDYHFATAEDCTMENDKESDTIFWNAEVKIYGAAFPVTVIVGGTADDHCLICSSVIWNKEKNRILWLAVKETREELGITSFKV